MNRRFSSFLGIGFTILIVALLCNPGYAELYSWKDHAGVLNFSNSRENVPDDAAVDVWPEASPLSPSSTSSEIESDHSQPEAVEPARSDAPHRPEAPLSSIADKADQVTQGRFALQLVEELGLGQGLTVEEAADLLTQIRVTPRLGRWDLEGPMSPALVARLRALTVSAAEMGTVSLKPEEALLAFDTTAALLGVPITAGAAGSDPGDLSSTRIHSPALVLITPPPQEIFTSYVWVPVQPGFFWSGVWCNGFFVLDRHGRDFRFNRHRFIIPPARIEQHFTNHVIQPHFNRGQIIGRRLRGRDPLPVPPSGPGRIDRPAERPPIASPPPVQPHLRGGAPHRSVVNGAGRNRPFPPSNFTPITPPSGTPFLSPLAPRRPMTPLAPTTPMTPMAGQQLRGRMTTRKVPHNERALTAPPAHSEAPPSVDLPRASLRGR
jgi:hypothetical protein